MADTTNMTEKNRFVRTWMWIGLILLALATLWVLGFLAPVVLFLAVGAIVGFICSPITNALEAKGVNRGLGALISLVIVVVVVFAIFAIFGPLFVSQMVELLGRVPTYAKEAQNWLKEFFQSFQDGQVASVAFNVQALTDSASSVLSNYATSLLNTITSGILPNVMNFFNVMFISFLGLVLAYWLAKDYPKMVEELAIIAGPSHQEGLTLLLAVTSRSMSGYMKGIVITSVFGGVLAFVGFLLVGQPYAALMGILTCLLHFIPVIGPFFSAFIATATALFVSPVCAFWTLVVAIVAENITDNVLSPVVMQEAVQVHPAMSLLAIVIGYAVGGGVGMALSVPISAAIKGVFVYYFETKTQRQLVSPTGALFQGRSYVYEDGTPAPSFDALDNDTFFKTSKVVPASEEVHLIHEAHALKDEHSQTKRTALGKLGHIVREKLRSFKRSSKQ